MVSPIDLGFLGRRGVIAAGLIEGPDGIAVVDPGPATTTEALRSGLAERGRSLADVRAILLTHIHLDHAGGVGVLLRDQPGIRVYVHERGAPHIIEPSRLLESANRLYGDRMPVLWGDILPVPAAAVRAVAGGDVLDAAGLKVRVAYTPGHASHHVSYFETASGTAFVGDTGGMRLGAPLLVIPPTPPPDIDIEAWDASLAAIRAWRPSRVFVTHFGGFDDVEAHLDDLEGRLHENAALARALLENAAFDDARRQAAFVELMMDVFRRGLPDEDWVRRHVVAVPMENSWQGLARYWRKRLGPRE
jgi:glyoxylase-like metal-dependent hydrolase (beta-lactamase superfamily II)